VVKDYCFVMYNIFAILETGDFRMDILKIIQKQQKED